MAASEFPSGTVTFLFTDIEGSPRLIEELGEERYVVALREHRRALREAFAAQGGVEVDTQETPSSMPSPRPLRLWCRTPRGSRRSTAGRSRCGWGLHTSEPRLTGEGMVRIEPVETAPLEQRSVG